MPSPSPLRAAVTAATLASALVWAGPLSASAVTSEWSGKTLPASAIAAVSTDGYLAPTTTITPAHGCIVLGGPGVKGVKVRLLQLRLGMGSRPEVMDAATIAAVQAFQVDNDLPRTDGVVDAATWSALGISEDFCFDRWQAAPALPIGAGSSERIQTMLDFAYGYIGAEYVLGGAGQPKYGVDCSGLVLQALYRAGLDPQPISIDKHVQPHYRTGYNLYHYPYLKHVPRSQMQRGDLIFYTSATTGAVNHVALYLGGNNMLEAKHRDVHVTVVADHYTNQTIAPDVVRPFP